MSEDKLTLPPFFPVVRRPCIDAAARFFVCFNKHSEMVDSEDTVGDRPLFECKTEMKLYTECMERVLKGEKE